MIQELLRSSLILGTVIVTSASLGTPGESVDQIQPSTAPPAPVSLVAPAASISLTRVLPMTAMQRLDAHLPRLPKRFQIASVRSGLATWYGKVRDQHRTANGEIFDSTLMTGASNLLPFGTRVRVTNMKNGKSVVVRVNDRGILSPGNIIDLTSAAADKIGMLRMGIAPVHLDVLTGAA